MIDLGP